MSLEVFFFFFAFEVCTKVRFMGGKVRLYLYASIIFVAIRLKHHAGTEKFAVPSQTHFLLKKKVITQLENDAVEQLQVSAWRYLY